MSLESVLYDRSQAHTGLAALIGTRFHAGGVMPQAGTLPAVTHQRVAASRPSAMGVDIGMVRGRLQFTAWASDPDGARAVADQVRAAFVRWRNTSGTVVQDIYFVSEVELYDESTQVYGWAVDLEIVYQE